jgi:hypothetical protein
MFFRRERRSYENRELRSLIRAFFLTPAQQERFLCRRLSRYRFQIWPKTGTSRDATLKTSEMNFPQFSPETCQTQQCPRKL